jgi:hypothetical protein
MRWPMTGLRAVLDPVRPRCQGFRGSPNVLEGEPLTAVVHVLVDDQRRSSLRESGRRSAPGDTPVSPAPTSRQKSYGFSVFQFSTSASFQLNCGF